MAGKPGRPPGRPSKYTEEIADLILYRLSNGDTLISICEEEGMPPKSTIFDWVEDIPGFSERYAKAREKQRESWAEEAMQASRIVRKGIKKIIRTKSNGDVEEEIITQDAVDRARLQVDTMKWFLARLDRNKYGDSSTVKLDMQGKDAGTFTVKLVHDPDKDEGK